MTLENYIEKIERGEPFSFTRYGDGEWNCILQPNQNKHNCDGHRYFPDLSEALGNILRSRPPYITGLQDHAIRINGDTINKWLEQNASGLNWVDADVFHRASIHGEFTKFIRCLDKSKVIMVAPEHLQNLDLAFAFVKIPSQDCWLDKERIMKEVKNLIGKEEGRVVLFCASMAANVMVDEMYYFNPLCTYLDMGSVFDPYAGKASRTYHKKIIERLHG